MGEPVTLARMVIAGSRDAIAAPHGMSSLLRCHPALANHREYSVLVNTLGTRREQPTQRRIAPFLHHDRIAAFSTVPQILETEEGNEVSVSC